MIGIWPLPRPPCRKRFVHIMYVLLCYIFKHPTTSDGSTDVSCIKIFLVATPLHVLIISSILLLTLITYCKLRKLQKWRLSYHKNHSNLLGYDFYWDSKLWHCATMATVVPQKIILKSATGKNRGISYDYGGFGYDFYCESCTMTTVIPQKSSWKVQH